VHRDDPWSVDLQASLNRRYATGAPILRLDLAKDLREDLGSWVLKPEASCLNGALLLLHLACHASCPLRSLTLMRLIELILVARDCERQAHDFWSKFVSLGELVGALPSTYPALKFMNELAPRTVPEDVLIRCARTVPKRVHRVVDRLSPADAQGLLRCSASEKFMWTPARRLPWQLAAGLLPGGSFDPSFLLHTYRDRAWRLLHRKLTA
jgi:hypothetical protein